MSKNKLTTGFVATEITLDLTNIKALTQFTPPLLNLLRLTYSAQTFLKSYSSSVTQIKFSFMTLRLVNRLYANIHKSIK